MAYYRNPTDPNANREIKILILLIAALGSAAVLGAIAAEQSLLLVAATIAGIILLLALAALPNMSTLIVLFVLYSNAAAVAVQFHGVPYLAGAAVPFLLMIPLTYYLIIRRERLIVTPVVLLLVLFVIVQLFGTLVSQDIAVSFDELITSVIEGLGLYLLIINVVRTTEMLRKATWALILAGAFIGALLVYQQATQTFDNNYLGFAQVSSASFGTGEETLLGEVRQPRLAGAIGEQNRHAQVMLMLIPLGLFRFWGEKAKRWRLLALVCTAFIGFGVAFAFSRGAAVGFVLMLVLMTFMRYIKLYQIAIILFGAYLLLQAVPQYNARLVKLEGLYTFFTPESDASLADADSVTRSRLTEMAAAGLVFMDNPLVGVGPGMFRFYYADYAERIGTETQKTRSAHSLLPGIAAENGVLGLLFFGLINFVTLRDLARARKKWLRPRPELTNLATGYLLSVVTYLTTGIFLHFGYVRFFWVIMALAGVAGYLATQVASRGREPVRSESDVPTEGQLTPT